MRGDRDAAVVFADQFLSGIEIEFGEGHEAASAGAFHEGAALADDRGGVIEAERARDGAGGNFAHGVAGDGVRFDAVGAPERGESDFEGEKDGLDDVDLAEVALGLVLELIEDVPVGAAEDSSVAFFEFLAEGGFVAEKAEGHAGPLAALAGEDESDAARGRGGVGVGGGFFAGVNAGLIFFFEPGSEAFVQFLTRVRHQSAAIVVMGAASGGGEGQVSERGRPGRIGGEAIAPVGGGTFEDRFGVAGKQKEFERDLVSRKPHLEWIHLHFRGRRARWCQ